MPPISSTIIAGHGTVIFPVSLVPGFNIEPPARPLWIINLLLSLRPVPPAARLVSKWSLPSPEAKTIWDHLPLLFDLQRREEEITQMIKLLQQNVVQEIADFVLFALYDIPSLGDDELNALYFLLDRLASAAGVVPQNISLNGIRSARSLIRGTDGREIKLSVKVVKAASVGALEACSPEIIRRIRLEHPNILPFYGIYALEASSACIISPWIKWNLQEYITSHTDAQERLPLIHDIINGLEYLHDNAIVHGNLTCDNVLVAESGRAMLADFGSYVDAIAGFREKSSDRWTAPEVLEAQSKTKASDTWSFGCLVYHIVSAKIPYWTCSDSRVRIAILGDELPSGPGFRLDVDALGSLMRACWQRHPNQRLHSWREIREYVPPVTNGPGDLKELTMSGFWKEARVSMRVSFDFERVRNNLLVLLKASHEEECLPLTLSIAARQDLRGRFQYLSKEDTHVVVNYLSEVLRKKQLGRGKWRLVILLSRLVSETDCFPQCHIINNVSIDYKKRPKDHGSPALIYEGKWQDQPVCVKITKFTDAKQRKLSIKELIMWAHFSHPNILPLYGVLAADVTESAGLSQLEHQNWSPVSPWMEHGNLRDYLTKHPNSPRFEFILDVLNGLEYLHGINIVHASLTSTNILVSPNGRAIITEFGKSNATTATAAGFTNLEGFTGNECPPELLREVFNEDIIEPSKTGDIWSLACLIYEIFSRRLAYFQYGGRLHEVIDALKRREIPKRPDGSESDFHPIADGIWYLLKKCWNFNPNERPQCKAILGSFQAFYPQYQPAGEDGHEIRTAKMNHQVDFYQVRNLLNKIATQGIPEPAHPSLIDNT